MRSSGHLSRLGIAAVVGLILTLSAFATAPGVSAHCPGGAHAYKYATAQKVLYSNKGAWASLQWANPTVCTPSDGSGFSAEWTTTCDETCGPGYGWAQVGWIKRTGWTQPKGYCELAASIGGSGYGSPPWLVEFPGTGTTDPYEVVEAGGTWWCFVDSVTRASRSTAWMGFAYGDKILAGGETIAPHSTIGVMAPSKFVLDDLRALVSGTWSLVDFSCCGADSPYGLDEPAVGRLRNWTNPH